MKVAIVLDNNVSMAQTHPFELIAESAKDMEFTVFIGEKNKGSTAGIKLGKRFLGHKKEAVSGLLNPFAAARRLGGNKMPRMDFYYFSLSRELKGFDAVYTQDITRSLYTVASLKDALGYRIILRWWENLPYKRLFSEKDSYIGERCLGKVDLFLPSTRMALDALALEGVKGERMEHIYPGIDTGRFSPGGKRDARSRFNVPEETIAVLFAGRLVSHKGLFTMLCAAKELERLSVIGNFIFLIAGSGGQRRQMEKMAEEMGVKKYFSFLGNVPYENIQELYRASDIFMLPSTMKENIQEQFGLVIAEALSCGVPVVGSSSGAIPEVVGDAGLIVPPGDYKALATAIKRLGEDRGLREGLGKKARQRAEGLFSSAKNADKLLKAIRSFE